MHYRHPRIGFAFDMPDHWVLDEARTSAEGVTIVLSLGDTRLLLQVRRSQGNAAARLNLMKAHLESLRATRIGPCPPPPLGPARDLVALGFFVAGQQQRWISVSQDGYDYTISHTDDWQDVGGAVDRLCASFIFPARAHIDHALPRQGADAPVSDRAPQDHPLGSAIPVTATGLWQRVGERLRRARLARTTQG